MLASFADIPDRGLSCDVAIVGGGAAGLTLARTLAAEGVDVVLLEAGGDKKTNASQEFYRGELVDLEERPWVPGSGWPIAYAELEANYATALEAAEAGVPAYAPADALPGEQEELAPGLDGDYVRTTVERFSRPTNFWRRYGAELARSERAKVFRNAPVTRIQLAADGNSVEWLDVAGPDGARRRITARTYVLALGGLETTRLLLASNDVRPDGIGNDSGQLGRNYMSHLCETVGTVTFAGPPEGIAYDYVQDREGIYLRRRLWLTDRAQREHGLLNTTFRTHLPEPGDPAHGDAVLSAMFLVKDMVLYEYSRKFVDKPVGWAGRARHVSNIVRQPLRLARFGTNWLRKRTFADRKLPSVVLGSAANRYALEFHAEQAPNPDSRLTLSAERDALGMPRLKVDWRITDLDIESLEKSYALLAAELERTGAGRLDFDRESIRERAHRHGIVGGHHIGTTRMAADPKQGVVDTHLRVHGVGNLYVASSSVFPTSGQANPTLTILALTLRLARHLSHPG